MWSAPAAEAASSPQAAPGNTVLEDFVESQCTAVAGLMLRTLLEELHHRRARGELAGETPEERYRSFRAWTNSPEGHAELLERYPRLFHGVRDRVGAAALYLAHVVAEVARERTRLDARMPGVAPGTRISAVALGEGDTHSGRSVARIRFDDGGQVVYKPHAMEAEAGFNDVVAWFNDRLQLGLPTVCVLPTAEGGFAEYVAADGHPDPERYFTLIGRLLGVLHLVKATDIHFENVVTCIRGPVVVDAETLLTPRRGPVLGGRDGSDAWGRALGILLDSVAGIGVLPMVMKSDPSDEGLDIGVIGYDQGQPVPYKALRIDNPGRDDMAARLVRLHAANTSTNLSVSQAAPTPVRTQRDIIKRELRRVLSYAAAHRDEVAAAIENRLGTARFRFIPAPTYFYSQLLRMATHPDAVRDRLVRAAVLHRGLLRHGSLDLAAGEARQMERGDVPYFTYTPHSRDLHSDDGGAVLADAFAQTPMEAVRERIAGLGEEAVQTQLRLVDFAFVNKLSADREPTGFTLEARPGDPAAIGDDRLLAEAARIGDVMLETMVDGADPATPATWLAPQISTTEESQWSPGALGYDLYSGTPGLAMALAGLARETGRARFRDAALRVVEPIEDQLRSGELDGAGVSIGGMTGMSGTLYGLWQANRLLGRDGLNPGALAEDLARRVEAGAGVDASAAGGLDPVDFVAGTAGALAVCLALHRGAAGADRDRAAAATAAVARTHVELLGGTGLADPRVTAYTGFAHGALGIAPGLAEYGAVFGDAAVADLGVRIARAGLDSYDPETGDWPRGWDEPVQSYAWCHGAPGMLLGALALLRHAPGALPEEHLARLAQRTAARGFGNNPTYCHGDLGSAETVLLADREAPGLFDPGAADGLYARLFDRVLDGYDRRADTKYTYTGSLLLGHAGTLWSILRHRDPDTYPSVLLLE
nr:type 2 lanthipeptide synthetase LanM family protein [Streptomonospora sp. PA3]